MVCILHRIWKLLYLLKNQQCQPWLAEFENIIHFYRQLINILTSSIYSRDLTFLKESTPRDLLPNKICRPYWRTSGINGPVACLKELPLVGWEQNELLGPPMCFFCFFSFFSYPLLWQHGNETSDKRGPQIFERWTFKLCFLRLTEAGRKFHGTFCLLLILSQDMTIPPFNKTWADDEIICHPLILALLARYLRNSTNMSEEWNRETVETG